MTYTVRGLDPARFAPLFSAPPELLAAELAEWRTVDSATGYPCRVTLEEARVGERVLLINYPSLDKPTPFRASHAIYVREGVTQAVRFDDALPPMMERRTLGLRGFTDDGHLFDGALAAPGDAHTEIVELLERPEVAYVDIHAAGYGCFLARAERS